MSQRRVPNATVPVDTAPTVRAQFSHPEAFDYEAQTIPIPGRRAPASPPLSNATHRLVTLPLGVQTVSTRVTIAKTLMMSSPTTTSQAASSGRLPSLPSAPPPSQSTVRSNPRTGPRLDHTAALSPSEHPLAASARGASYNVLLVNLLMISVVLGVLAAALLWGR